MTADEAPGLAAYVRFWETLRPDTLDDLEGVTAPDVRFIDPFNDVAGRDALRGVLAHMFAHVKEPTFQVLEAVPTADGAVLRWRFTGDVPVLGPWDVEGMSWLRFDEAGRVSRHEDFWDTSPAVWLRLPLIGWLLRRVAARLGAGRRL